MHLYILFAVLLVKAVEPFTSCNQGNFNQAESMFNSLSNDVIDLSKKVYATCMQFPTFAAREVFGANAYRLEIRLEEFGSAHFDIQIKHRVIYINGHYPRQGNDCDLTYVDIKVLPEFANTHSATWTYSGGNLIVAMPYLYALEENIMYCRNIDSSVINVRKGFPNDPVFFN